jgi:hypothetical protein
MMEDPLADLIAKRRFKTFVLSLLLLRAVHV